MARGDAGARSGLDRAWGGNGFPGNPPPPNTGFVAIAAGGQHSLGLKKADLGCDPMRGARREAFAHAIALTQHYAPHAANTLAKIMADTTAPHNARVSAASTLLKFARESIELDELVGSD